VARPDAFVVAVAVGWPPENVPLAPEDGEAKVTDTPDTGLPFESLTSTCRPVANVVDISALCGVPADVLMKAAVLLARLRFFNKKLAAPALVPGTEAVTV
jgi:hypothetical protein